LVTAFATAVSAQGLGANIAEGKPVTCSSFNPAGVGGSEGEIGCGALTDGVIRTEAPFVAGANPASFWQSEQTESGPVAEIDLQGDFSVALVAIHNWCGAGGPCLNVPPLDEGDCPCVSNCGQNRTRDIQVTLLNAAREVIHESGLLNPENVLGNDLNAGNRWNAPTELLHDLSDAPVGDVAYVQVKRVADDDLSSSGGSGVLNQCNDDESRTTNISEIRVFAPGNCPGQGDSPTCEELFLTRVPDDVGPGVYRVDVATVPANPGDAIFEFTATNGGAEPLQGNRIVNQRPYAFFDLGPGQWTISCTTYSVGQFACEGQGSTCADSMTLVCPAAGDTHCNDPMDLFGPPGDGPGLWDFEVFGEDESGDLIHYSIEVESEGALARAPTATVAGKVQPQVDDGFFTVNLSEPGDYEVRGTVDDNEFCPDVADDATCVDGVTVIGSGINEQLQIGKTIYCSSASGGRCGEGINGNLGDVLHTVEKDANATVVIDLEAVADIRVVTLFSRTVCCQSRTRDMVVTLQNLAPGAGVGAGITVRDFNELPERVDVFQSGILNPENILGGGTLAGPDKIELDLQRELGRPVQARFVQVERIADPDLSGTGGEGQVPGEDNVINLAEIDVRGNFLQNVALDKPVECSSASGGRCQEATDGNLGNTTHTVEDDTNPNLTIDLEGLVEIDRIVVHNRGGGAVQSRLRDITVSVLGPPTTTRDFGPDGMQGTEDDELIVAPGPTTFVSDLLNRENVLGGQTLDGPPFVEIDFRALFGSSVVGQFVNVHRTPDPDLSGSGGEGQVPGEDAVFSTSEVEIFGRFLTNVALNKSIFCSSASGGRCAEAVDGNRGNVQSTAGSEEEPFVEIDLEGVFEIEQIIIFARGDGFDPWTMCDFFAEVLSANGDVVFDSGNLNPMNVLGGMGLAGPSSLEVNIREVTGNSVIGSAIRVRRQPDTPEFACSSGLDAREPVRFLLVTGEIEAYGRPAQNLALSKAVTCSSASGGRCAQATNGNLGDTTHTVEADLNPRVVIDLGAEFSISFLNVYNRGGGAVQSRLRDITVELQNVANGGAGVDLEGLPARETVHTSELLNPENLLGGGTLDGPPVITYDLRTAVGEAVTAQFVKIGRTPDLDLSGSGGEGQVPGEDTVLSLAEVEVFGGRPLTDFSGFQRGDCNSDQRRDLSDPVVALNFAFLGSLPPTCLESCDFNGDGRIDITNSVYYLNFLFIGGPPIPDFVRCTRIRGTLGCEQPTCFP
jgi:hypothetical protein